MANNSTASARDTILARIQSAIGSSAQPPAIQAEWAAIPRTYTRQATRSHEAILELLTDRLIDYDAHVIHVPASGVREAVAQRLTTRKAARMMIPAGIPTDWLPTDVTFIEDDAVPSTELDSADGVLSGATLAIAETGTIVLQNALGQGRRALSLVPDYHLCIVHADSVVETVSEAMAKLSATATLATTFISGPSATADIEMTRIKGVHGPRFLDVILVD